MDTGNNLIAGGMKRRAKPDGCYRRASRPVCQGFSSSRWGSNHTVQLKLFVKHCLPFLQRGNRIPHLQTIASGHLVAAFLLWVTLTKSAVGSTAGKGDLLLTTTGQKEGGPLPEHTQNISGSGSKELLHHYSKGRGDKASLFILEKARVGLIQGL